MPPFIIDSESFILPEKHYYQVVQEKRFIVLHFTSGRTVKSAYDYWMTRKNSKGTVATAYIVGRELEVPNQTSLVCQLFDPKYWAYHLSAGKWFEQRTIGIEVANIGPLRRRGDTLYWWPNNWNTPYCSINAETLFYKEALQVGNEVVEYWATFTEEQIKAVIRLCLYLCDEFDIEKALVVDPNEPLDLNMIRSSPSIGGILGHRNFNRPDKYDPGMAFPFNRLRSMASASITRLETVNDISNKGDTYNKDNNNKDNKLLVIRGTKKVDKLTEFLRILFTFVLSLFKPTNNQK